MKRPCPSVERGIGFSLIEVLVALSLVALSAVAFMQLLDSAHRADVLTSEGEAGLERGMVFLAEDILGQVLDGGLSSGTIRDYPRWDSVEWSVSREPTRVPGLEWVELELEAGSDGPAFRLERLVWTGEEVGP